MTKFRVLMSLLLKNHADRPGEGKGGRFEERDDRFEERRRPERPEKGKSKGRGKGQLGRAVLADLVFFCQKESIHIQISSSR